jgi:hypothetical protein
MNVIQHISTARNILLLLVPAAVLIVNVEAVALIVDVDVFHVCHCCLKGDAAHASITIMLVLPPSYYSRMRIMCDVRSLSSLYSSAVTSFPFAFFAIVFDCLLYFSYQYIQ